MYPIPPKLNPEALRSGYIHAGCLQIGYIQQDVTLSLHQQEMTPSIYENRYKDRGYCLSLEVVVQSELDQKFHCCFSSCSSHDQLVCSGVTRGLSQGGKLC